MTHQTATVVIIGAGIVGASVAYHLAARGCTDVLLLERADSPVTGSTARSAAGVRHQFANEVNIRLSKYSIERLKHFHEEIGGHSELQQVGYLFLINDEATWGQYRQQVELQNRLGVRTQLLKPEDVHQFVPGTRLDDLVGATFGPDDGYCDPYGVATGYLARARDMGVQLRTASPITTIYREGGRVTGVETPTGRINCEIVVNAAGAWSGEIGKLAGLDVPVQPYRRNLYMTEPFPEFPSAIPLTIDVASGFWMRNEQQSVLFGLSKPDEVPGENLNVDWDWLDTVLDAGLARFPVLERAALVRQRCWAGLYEITPDHMPVLGRHPDVNNFVNANGFSGHGVMHSPATGLLIAEEILDGRAHTINIDELRITRFQDAKIHAEANIF